MRAKLFFNWLLSREGQELHGKTAQQPTRRLDVDTRGLDGQAAKDVLTVEQFRRFQNFTEDKCNNSWIPGAKLAEAVLEVTSLAPATSPAAEPCKIAGGAGPAVCRNPRIEFPR